MTEAKSKYEKMLYETRTKGKTIEEFQLFINQYPTSPYIAQAEEQIYLLAIKGEKTSLTYSNFIQSYPTNRYVKDAWQMIEQMEINYSDTSTITLFLNKYKNYPNVSKLQKIMLQYQKVLYPVKAKNGKWGFMDETGKLLIAAGYEKAQNFYNGLAMVQKDGKFGYVNKGNTVVIPITYDNAYDFKGDYARVRANKMWGILNRKGEVVIPVIYDDISDFNAEGLAKVKKGGKWGLVDRNNRQIVEPTYDQILDFVEGLCLVRKDDTWLYIDKYGVKVYCAE
ncbi:MAG: WG repeat-containing protein [Bacteroidota bacterium]